MGPLSAGSLFANRFEIDRAAGSGGMGTVYRARDLYSGNPVALKLLHQSHSAPDEPGRFSREVQILSQLCHPNIVSHIAHGLTADGQRYLAMEWLDGEDLGQRLLRGPLPLRDCISLLTHVADALSVAHRQGIIHRDIKPSNLFLCGQQVASVKLLDFGIARRLGALHAMTRTGAVIGTPEYMAPEQARGVRELTPAVDVFSLGCVLYECLTGQPPFVADHMAAVLVRILFEEPTPVEEKRLGVPQPLTALLSRMLAKDPAQRPADAAALEQALKGLGGLEDAADEPPQTLAFPASRSFFAETDQRLYSVVIAAIPATSDEASGEAADPARKPELLHEERYSLERALQTLGVQADFLASGALVATVSQTGSATDQAIQAARAALLIKERWSSAVVSLATGRGVMQGRTAVGEVVDRAAQFLQRRDESGALLTPRPGVSIDELSARLLEGRFAFTPQPDGAFLLSEEKDVDVSRPLLGKPTPCVGRETELGILEAQLTGCLEESEARAVLVTAPPGTGKSRLRHEFLRRTAQRSDQVTVLLGRGDLTTAGAPYGILGQALRRASGIAGGEPLEAQRARIAAHLGRLISPPERSRVIEFVGELCGIRFCEHESAALKAAHSDSRLMHDQIRRAFLDWLGAACKEAGVLVVLDDLQWGDTLSVSLIDSALRELRSAPLCVLALARPEVRELFPRLWPGHQLQDVPLKPLSRKACERLIQQVLGKQVPASVVSRIIEQSTGNALFLEELIRAAGEGEGNRQPETVMAMLQARIGRFELGPRRAVRAASVFGQTFWRGGVTELLGVTEDLTQVDGWLHALVEAEMIEPHPDSRFAGEQQYGFRHALVRDAAYSLLTAADLAAGHRLAARYLERVGEPESLVLAEHYRRGGEPLRTVPLYMRAGDNAGSMGALPEARRHYEEAKSILDTLPDSIENRRSRIDALLRQAQLAMASDPLEQNIARLTEARALLASLSTGDESQLADRRRGAWIDFLSGRIYFFQNKHAEAFDCFRRTLPVAEALGDEEILANSSIFIGGALCVQGQVGKAQPFLSRAVALRERLDSDYERLRAVGYCGVNLTMQGQYREAIVLHDQMMHIAGKIAQPASFSLAHLLRALALLTASDYHAVLQHALLDLEHAEKSGDKFHAYVAHSLIGWAQGLLGKPQEAILHRAKAQVIGQGLGGRLIFADWFDAADIEIALAAGDPGRALALAEKLVPELRKGGYLVGLGRAEQAWGVAIERSDPARTAEADAHLVAGLEVMEQSQQVLAAARLRLEWARLCQLRGALEQAEKLARQALSQFEAAGCPHVVANLARPQ